ncbi:MAG: DUF4956 domain-containing protein [Sphingobacteriales bacterium]|jgi:hypothetical protein
MMMQDPIVQIGLVILILLTYSVAYFLIRGRLIYSAVSFLIGITTYFLILVLSKNEFGIAAGLGLFAIFGIIRYRTEQVPILEMTYIFLSITIAVISALADGIVNTFMSVILIDACLITLSVILFAIVNRREEEDIKVVVDSIEWLNMSPELQLSFLSEKSFKNVLRFQVVYIDWLKESAVVNVTVKKK